VIVTAGAAGVEPAILAAKMRPKASGGKGTGWACGSVAAARQRERCKNDVERNGAMKRVLILLAVSALAAMAADVAGTWKATADGPNGTMERTFVFKVDGNRLSGETTSTMLGKSTLADGKVDGDNLSFTIIADMQGTELKLNYKGKVSGSELHLTSERAGGGGQSIEWTGKKVQ
jgi:hypothetical protein